MSYPDLPAAVKTMLANEGHRVHHRLWHNVRNEQAWNSLPQSEQDSLTAADWKAPRFDGEPGAGIDFLGMHREMINMTNNALAAAGDPNWTKVIGWDPIPFEDENADWPVPEWQTTKPAWASEEEWEENTAIAEQTRSEAMVNQMKTIAAFFKDPARLKTMTLDELGSRMEFSIHGWMHIRWSGAPPADEFSVDPNDDWLFTPWSSHVNKTFWKLHGWIDERITDWEKATGNEADLSDAWSGPAPVVPGAMMHMAEAKLLKHLPPLERSLTPMVFRQSVVDELLKEQ